MNKIIWFVTLLLFLIPNSAWAVFTNAWTETEPTDATYGNLIDDYMRQFNTSIRERMAIDHYFLSSDLTTSDSVGYHKAIHLIDESTTPDTHTYGGILYSTKVGGVSSLYFLNNSGTSIRITDSSGVDSGNVVMVTGDQTVGGDKTFSDNVSFDTFPRMTISDDPTLDSQLVTKSYVDTQIPLLSQSVQVDTAIGTTDISTNSTTYVDMADMTYTDTFTAGNVVVTGKVPLTIGSNDGGFVQLVIDDVAVDTTWIRDGSGDAGGTAVVTWAGWFTAASHSIQVKWKQHASGDSVQNTGTTMPRRLTIIRGLN